MPFVECCGTTVEYRLNGAGRGLVLVHGTGQTAENSWGLFAPHFYRERAVLRPNLAGSGKTTLPDGPLTLDLLARQVLAAVDDAGLTESEFDIAGHSLGACVAVRTALLFPERVGKLVLLGGFASAADARMQAQFRLWKRLIASDAAALAELSLFSAFSPEFFAARDGGNIRLYAELAAKHTNWEGMERQIDLNRTIDLTGVLAEVRQPALVIGCAKDFIVPPETHAKALAAGIPGAVYRELDAGHAAGLERPVEFLAMAKEFLA